MVTINAQERARKLYEEGWKPMGYLMLYNERSGAANLQPHEEDVYLALKKIAFGPNYDALIRDNRCTACGREMSVDEARASGHSHLDD